MSAPRSLVVRLDSAGDVLLAGPAVRAVAAGSSHTTLLCGPQGVPAARLLPGVDQVLVYSAPWVGLEPGRTSREECGLLVDALAAGRFDRGVILVSYHQSPLPTALLLALASVERVAADCEEYPGSLLALRHHRLPGRHEAEAALDLVRAFGYSLPPGDDGALRIQPPPDSTRLTGPEPYVVLHPGAAVASRRWSAGRAARAVAALHGAGHRVVVTGSRAEKDLTAEVAGRHGLDLGGATADLHELAGVLAGADVVVTGNTGPMHLACAVGTPVVCAFAPVVPAERWRPYRVPHVLLGDQTASCADSRARDCPVVGHPCLDGIGDGEVLTAVAALLAPAPVIGSPAGTAGDRERDRGATV
ncbi:glycosyltransferase family 9 protein [Streptomyces turgidiscabies]|uniref:ADP-heptose:LPS heptosyltransferase n=1 Tax=Streptomyces turgidiscabies TaxID=85558 RepID=A0ABU0S0G0_9ACTN|nr:glycosyltransferase family 9 protein [Streptomyces turgidiscabies]MDQ0937722.1 ADP-heptose:LPS heptosyltransferase [Streptomyces turgidiscabies]